ncbi:hypothetical protein [Clostridium sp.]|uniref:hypothetical protein n=1 Tax=Clostridium sp. TaxID=1506 RepID=UPI00321658D2
MSVYGQYDNRNFVEVNFFDIDEDINSTLVHEHIHLRLTQSTRWGNLGYCLRKIDVIDESKKHFSKFIHKNTIKVQEATAVYFEILYLLKSKGELEAKNKINKLKQYNIEYYNYLKPLIPLIETFLKSDINIEQKANEVTTMIYHIAINSLNTNICDVSTDHFQDKKNITKFISNAELSAKLLPFPRFKQLIKQCFEKIESSNGFDAGEIINELIDFNEQIMFLNDNDFREKDIDKIKDFILKLFRNSENINEIKSYLNTVKVKEVDIEEAICYAIPNSFKKYKSNHITSVNETNTALMNAQKSGIILILGEIVDSFEMIRPYYKIANKDMEIISKKYGGYYLITIIEYFQKKQSFTLMTRGRLIYILSKNNHPIVVSYKTFDYDKMKISGLLPLTNDIFIYCDRSYPNAIEIINSISSKTMYSIIINYEGMAVLLLKIDTNLYFFLPVLSVVEYKIRRDVEDGKLNIKILDSILVSSIEDKIYISEDGEKVVEFPEFKMNKMDRIINNMFNL